MTMLRKVLALGLAGVLTTACGGRDAEPDPPPAKAVVQVPDLPTIAASGSPTARAIDQAVWTTPAQPGPAPAQKSPSGEAAASQAGTDQAAANAADEKGQRDAMIRAQVLLDRAHFSPGVIDGKLGDNVQKAIAAFEQAKGLPVNGQMDQAVWDALVRADARPVMTDYTITQDDVDGPFVSSIPESMAQKAKLERLAYTGPLEALAEKFHMDQDLLKALNPDADFGRAGTQIIVAATLRAPLAGEVTKVEVDKTKGELRAFGADGRLMAVYPATVGSEALPAPDGVWEVRAVAEDPTYTYDPERLSWGDESEGKLTIPPGPNNPVGTVWIDLSKDTYGIHGAPEPALVSKQASHGCVRLTNWDAMELAKAVNPGAQVVFVGSEARPDPKPA